jgi:cell pole-organizing protein PopZ
MSFPKDNQEEMSMEDILSSIRKYVSEGETKPQNNEQQHECDVHCDDEKVVKLNESDVFIEDNSSHSDKKASVVADIPVSYEEVSTLSKDVFCEKRKVSGPFAQLTNALNSYGKNKMDVDKQNGGTLTVDQLFISIAEKVISEWVDKNLKSVTEEIVLKEIEKIKAEG